MTLEYDAKFEKKTDLWFGKSCEEFFANFYQSTQNS